MTMVATSDGPFAALGSEEDRYWDRDEWIPFVAVDDVDAATKRAVKLGDLHAVARLDEPGTARTVRARASGHEISDGPFIESKEWLVGFYLVDCGQTVRPRRQGLQGVGRSPHAKPTPLANAPAGRHRVRRALGRVLCALRGGFDSCGSSAC